MLRSLQNEFEFEGSCPVDADTALYELAPTRAKSPLKYFVEGKYKDGIAATETTFRIFIFPLE